MSKKSNAKTEKSVTFPEKVTPKSNANLGKSNAKSNAIKKMSKKRVRKKTYECQICNYSTKNVSNYKKHCLSKKHKRKQLLNWKSEVPENKESESSESEKEHDDGQVVGLINPDYLKLVKENQKLKEQLKDNEIKYLKEHVETLKSIKGGNTMGNNNNINSNNTNNITVNMYLNDHCKDAMFLDDFVKQIKLKLADVIQGEMPVENAISNVFIQKLEDLDPTERPIHCTDQKRKQFMVNDKSEGWIKDNTISENSKLKDSLTTVQQKAMIDVYDEFDEKYKPPHKDHLEEKKSKLVGLIRDPLISGKGTNQILKDVAPVINIKDAIKELKNKK